MATVTGTGASKAAGREGVLEAVRGAAARLGPARAEVGFLFVSPGRDMTEVMAAAKEASPGTRFLACTTAGEITEAGLTHGGVAAMLVSSGEMLSAFGEATGIGAEPANAANMLCRDYAETSARARAKGWGLSTTVLFADGLGAAEKLVESVVERVRFGQRVIGGGAGDEGRVQRTEVAGETLGGPDAAVCAHFFGGKLWGVGVGHGLRPASAPMRVTRSSGNLVQELDGKPAIEAYRTLAAAKGTPLTAENSGRFFLENELGLMAGGELYRVRSPLGVTPDGALACAGALPQGSSVSFMTGSTTDMVAGVRHAAMEARSSMKSQAVAGVFLFSCICRGFLLGDQYQREIDVVREVFPGAPIAGFLSYGEIARYQGSLDGYHNNTVVIAAIPA